MGAGIRRLLLAGSLALIAPSGLSHAATIESLTTDGTAISTAPEFASILVTVEYETVDDQVDVLAVLVQGEITRLILNREDVSVSDPDGDGVATYTFEWTGSDTDDVIIPPGTHELQVTVTDSDGSATASVPDILVDRTGPQIVRADLLGPEGAYQNGDILAIELVTDERPDSLWLDTTTFDDDSTSAPPTITEVAADTTRFTYTVTYRIGADNQIADAPNRILTVGVRDSLFNETTTGQDLGFCLSNRPVVHLPPGDLDDDVEVLFASLVEADGSPVVPDRSYTRGDTVRVRTVFQVARADSAELAALRYIGDFSELDSEFAPFSGQGATTPAPVVTDELPDSLLAGEDYSFITTTTSYVISLLNLRPEGTYSVRVTVSELTLGCGEAETRPIPVVLRDLGPPPPEFDPMDFESSAEDIVELSGLAPGALRVEIARADSARGVAAVLDTLSGRFTGTVPLERGWNRFVAIGFGRFNHPSSPSQEVAIYRVGATSLDAPARFRPGDPIVVSTDGHPDRIELEIWNLASDRIWAESVFDPGELHEFVWSGRNLSGERVKTGPYIIHVVIHRGGRASSADRAIVFTRR
jgi:hypothetical protein